MNGILSKPIDNGSFCDRISSVDMIIISLSIALLTRTKLSRKLYELSGSRLVMANAMLNFGAAASGNAVNIIITNY